MRGATVFLSLGLGSVFFLLSTESIANQRQQFGYPGQSGHNGSTGRSGRNGEDIVTIANGQFALYDIAGQDGEHGGRATYGTHASNCFSSPNNPPYHLQGANGGDGGHGGKGGKGGDGGNFRIHYKEIADLRNIQVDNSPGRSGWGGEGGQAGQGCRCSMSSWQAEVNGQPQTFYCTNGRNGYQGRAGSKGAKGSYGQVVLIGQLDPVKSENTEAQFRMTEMESQQFTLSKNIWKYKSGTANLFAIGSRVPNNYWQFIERIERSYHFKWEVGRPLDDFSGQWIWLSLNNSHDITWTNSGGIWHDGYEAKNEDGSYTYHFTKAVYGYDVPQFEFNKAEGHGKGLVASWKDRSDYPEMIENEIEIYYQTYAGGYYTRYNAVVPKDKIVQDGNIITVKVGELPIKEEYLKPGVYSRTFFYVTRKVGQNSGTWYIYGDYYIQEDEPS